jgi:hypothetical protein
MSSEDAVQPLPSVFPHRVEPAAPYISHTKREYPAEKGHPHLAFSRLQWPVLLAHLKSPSTREDALGSCLRLFTLESNVSCAMVDAPGVVEVLSGYVGGEEYDCVGTRVPALQCLGRVLRHGGYRSASLVQATAPAIAAACCTPHPPLRTAAYAAIASAAQGSPSEGAAAAVGAGFADSLVLRLLSEIPEHGRGRGGEEACLGALVALREVLCSSGGRTAGALPRALSSGLVGALLEAACLEGASEGLREAALACLGVCAGDAGAGGARAALLHPASAARLFPLLFAALGVRGSRDGSLAIPARAAAALASLGVVDEGKRAALRVAGGMEAVGGAGGGGSGSGGEHPLPDPVAAGIGLDALAQILLDAGEGGPPGPPCAGPAALAACSAISTLSQHPVARFAFMKAPKIKRETFEGFAAAAREGRYGGKDISLGLERACTGAWDAVLWKP